MLPHICVRPSDCPIAIFDCPLEELGYVVCNGEDSYGEYLLVDVIDGTKVGGMIWQADGHEPIQCNDHSEPYCLHLGHVENREGVKAEIHEKYSSGVCKVCKELSDAVVDTPQD